MNGSASCLGVLFDIFLRRMAGLTRGIASTDRILAHLAPKKRMPWGAVIGCGTAHNLIGHCGLCWSVCNQETADGVSLDGIPTHLWEHHPQEGCLFRPGKATRFLKRGAFGQPNPPLRLAAFPQKIPCLIFPKRSFLCVPSCLPL
jgi:hypothetical protein